MFSAPDLNLFDLISIFSYTLVALSYTMRSMVWLRAITLVGCLIDLVVYYFIRPGQPMWVQISFNGLIIAINAYQLWRIYDDQQHARFEGLFQKMYAQTFQKFQPTEFRKLLKIGQMREVVVGEKILQEGFPVASIFVVVEGVMGIQVGNKDVSSARPGQLLGEIAFLNSQGTTATATVTAQNASTLFEIPCQSLTKLLEHDEALKAALYMVLGLGVIDKLVRMNEYHQQELVVPG